MIRILYRCACMQDHGSFDVRERRKNEDAGDWMQLVVRPTLAADHAARNALCQSRTVEEVKIPVDEGTPIGNRRPT